MKSWPREIAYQIVTNNPDELAVKFYHKLAGTKLVYFENKGGWSRLSKPERRFRKFELCCLAEQAPNPDGMRDLERVQPGFADMENRGAEFSTLMAERYPDISVSVLEIGDAVDLDTTGRR